MRGIEGKIEAIRYARTKGIPFFGICLGMQCAVIEFARNVLGLDDANTTEFDQNTQHPVIALMEEQAQRPPARRRRCGWAPGPASSPRQPGPRGLRRGPRSRNGTATATSSTTPTASTFEENGFVVTGTSPDGKLVEIIELPNHPWFLAVQFHPEFKSKPTKAHPLFRDFVGRRPPAARRGPPGAAEAR